MGSKNPTSRLKENKEDKWEITARKDLTKDWMSKLGETLGSGVLSFANH
jgi:hypothetical protein